MGGTIALLGPGDLGTRIAFELAKCAEVGEITFASRALDGERIASLINACYGKRTRHVQLDVSSTSAVERFLRRERSDLLVHCASLLSPWRVGQLMTREASLLSSAGFVAQLPAQLSLISTVMRAVKETAYSGPVVNCSYPDVVNAILEQSCLAPTIGIGNVSMMRHLVISALLANGHSHSEELLVRVLGHHSQVTSMICSVEPDEPSLRPLVFFGEEGDLAQELLYKWRPLPNDVRLNALAARSATEIILALLPGSPKLRSSAPGPLGLQGGYPVLIENQSVSLDLPVHLSLEDAKTFHAHAGYHDGIAGIDVDGTVHFTPRAEALLSACDTRLAEPLHPEGCGDRFQILRQYINS